MSLSRLPRGLGITAALLISGGVSLAVWTRWIRNKATRASCEGRGPAQLESTRALQECLEREQRLLAREKQLRESERAGRIRAERSLREANETMLALTKANSTPQPSGGDLDGSEGNPAPADEAPADTPPPLTCHSIGTLRSCFTHRNGTPRQPLLVPAARARLELAPWVPAAALEGLEEWSHCWVLYVFHANTDAHRTTTAPAAAVRPGATFRAKVRVPRLDGGKMGVLATRSPHRPVAIGLSTARIEHVQGRTLSLSGIDIIDGSPVLDVKPYVPFSDAVPEAVAPPWVHADAPADPLFIEAVHFEDGAREAIRLCWTHTRGTLSASPEAFTTLIQQVLSRDIRSAYQRSGKGDAADGPPVGGRSQSYPKADAPRRVYHVVLEGVDIAYTITEQQTIHVLGGSKPTE